MIYALPVSIAAMLGFMFWNTAVNMRRDVEGEPKPAAKRRARKPRR